MRKRIYWLALLSVVVLFFINGCDQSPIENNYYYTGVDSLSDPNTLPRVVFTNPANGSTAHLETLIQPNIQNHNK